MRCAVLLGAGKHPDERAGFRSGDGPRLEFVEIANALDADVHSFASGAHRRGGWFRKAFSKRPILGSVLNMALLSRNYDRIYATGEDIGFRTALLLKASGWKGRMICVVHNLTETKTRVLRLLRGQIISHFVVVSADQARKLMDAGVRPDSIVRQYNWVDVQFFSPGAEELTPTQINFVACGAENRDYETLAKACEKTGYTTYIFGHGFFGENAARLGSNERNPAFRLMKRAPWDELLTYYRGATAIVVPVHSVPYAAGVTGLVEAMAVGRPVIATKSPGIAEYVVHLDPALTVEPGDYRGMAEAMRQIASDPARFSAAARSNREWALAHCSLDAYVARIRDLMLA